MRISAVLCIAILNVKAYRVSSETTQYLVPDPNPTHRHEVFFAFHLLRSQLINSDDLIANRIQDDFAHRMQMQFSHKVAAMSLRGLHAASQDYRHFFGGLTFGDELKNLTLAIREGW